MGTGQTNIDQRFGGEGSYASQAFFNFPQEYSQISLGADAPVQKSLTLFLEVAGLHARKIASDAAKTDPQLASPKTQQKLRMEWNTALQYFRSSRLYESLQSQGFNGKTKVLFFEDQLRQTILKGALPLPPEVSKAELDRMKWDTLKTVGQQSLGDKKRWGSVGVSAVAGGLMATVAAPVVTLVSLMTAPVWLVRHVQTTFSAKEMVRQGVQSRDRAKVQVGLELWAHAAVNPFWAGAGMLVGGGTRAGVSRLGIMNISPSTTAQILPPRSPFFRAAAANENAYTGNPVTSPAPSMSAPLHSTGQTMPVGTLRVMSGGVGSARIATQASVTHGGSTGGGAQRATVGNLALKPNPPQPVTVADHAMPPAHLTALAIPRVVSALPALAPQVIGHLPPQLPRIPTFSASIPVVVPRPKSDGALETYFEAYQRIFREELLQQTLSFGENVLRMSTDTSSSSPIQGEKADSPKKYVKLSDQEVEALVKNRTLEKQGWQFQINPSSHHLYSHLFLKVVELFGSEATEDQIKIIEIQVEKDGQKVGRSYSVYDPTTQRLILTSILITAKDWVPHPSGGATPLAVVMAKMRLLETLKLGPLKEIVNFKVENYQTVVVVSSHLKQKVPNDQLLEAVSCESPLMSPKSYNYTALDEAGFAPPQIIEITNLSHCWTFQDYTHPSRAGVPGCSLDKVTEALTQRGLGDKDLIYDQFHIRWRVNKKGS